MKRILSPELLGELIGVTGMTQAEAAEYLGVTHSALRLQCRGRSATPVESVMRIWRLIEGVLGDRSLPDDAPDSVRLRRDVLRSMRALQSGTAIMRIDVRALARELEVMNRTLADIRSPDEE